MATVTAPAATPIVAETAALEAIFAHLLRDPAICPRRLMDAASLLVGVERTATPGLFLVTVTVSRGRPDGSRFETKLTQYVLDPTIRGSTTGTDADASGNTAGTTGTTGGGL